MTELPPAEVQRRWQHQIVANNRLAAGNAQLRSLLTAARAYVSREASGVGGAEARALIGEIDGVLGRDGGG